MRPDSLDVDPLPTLGQGDGSVCLRLGLVQGQPDSGIAVQQPGQVAAQIGEHRRRPGRSVRVRGYSSGSRNGSLMNAPNAGSRRSRASDGSPACVLPTPAPTRSTWARQDRSAPAPWRHIDRWPARWPPTPGSLPGTGRLRPPDSALRLIEPGAIVVQDRSPARIPRQHQAGRDVRPDRGCAFTDGARDPGRVPQHHRSRHVRVGVVGDRLVFLPRSDCIRDLEAAGRPDGQLPRTPRTHQRIGARARRSVGRSPCRQWHGHTRRTRGRCRGDVILRVWPRARRHLITVDRAVLPRIHRTAPTMERRILRAGSR